MIFKGIEEGDLRLSPLDEETLEFARQLRNHDKTRLFLADTAKVSELQQANWFRKMTSSTSSARHVAYLDGVPFGVVRLDYIDEVNSSICVGMDIHPDFRGQGLSFRTYSLLFKLLFEDLGFNRVWLFVGGYNDRAIHIYQKLGFVVEGEQRQALWRNGKFWGNIMMSILQEEWNERSK